jgi:hypothetical protein
MLNEQDGQTWKDHVHNFVPCHLPHMMVKLIHLSDYPYKTLLMLCEQSTRATTMLICDWCSNFGIWYVSHHHWKKCWLENNFALGAQNKPRCLFLKLNIFKIIHIWIKKLKDCNHATN